MAQPPPQVLELIQRFDRNHEAYRSPNYNETQLRREFLDPLFKALGWDMDNEQGSQYMEKVPIRPINLDKPADKSRRDQIAQLAEEMSGLQQRLSAAKTPQEKTALERQITASDSQIDRLVYDLYGLTEKEIKIVEGAVA
jgi:predicted type IV restriction endonuclease